MAASVVIVFSVQVRLMGATPELAAADGYNPRIDGPGIYMPGSPCDTGHFSDAVVPCAQGPADAPHTAVLFGDSVGAQWLSALPEIYPAPEWQVVIITKSSCPPVDEDFYYERIGKVYDVCSRWRDAAIDEIRRLDPDVLFLGSSLNYAFTSEQWTAGTDRILGELAPAAGRIGLLSPNPDLGFDGPRCAGSEPGMFDRLIGDSASRCTRPLAGHAAIDVATHLAAAAASYPTVTPVSLNGIVCPNGICSARSDEGLFVYRDDKHLTDTFVRRRVSEIAARLAAAGLDPASLTSRTRLAGAE